MASNRNVLKKYAPQARLDFIQAVTNRAAQFGITKEKIVAGEVQGDLFILNGKAFSRSVANQRGRLISRIARDGFTQTMEAVAYTWFNRFLAIRYMELHDYFDHGCRVLSNSDGHAEPEILEKSTGIDLPGLNRDEIVNLKLDGTKDEQIYRKLLIAQCNDLHRAMPFLFEKIDDETELLLPENLLQSDSIVRKLVNEIAEAEWQEIEIIGWLYQFYISEKKDQVIGKVVKSEDIPAATQLFTPNWIVKYMVQNSLGAQWLATYPDSGIRAGMEYYIAPAEQTPEVQAQIDAITPGQLNPEAITLIDPAVGSGHILVEAYDLFRAIYMERGYTKREAARAILTKNLFGLDIDDRAAQMAGFALLMRACADDRTVLRNPPKLNVLALQDSAELDAEALAKALLPQERFEMVPSGDLLPETLSQPTLSAQQPTSAEAQAIKTLVTLFDGAKTFGSLITVPDAMMQSLPLLDALLAKPLTGDLLLRQAQEDAQEALKPLVEQVQLLGGRYDCVVANPPYMNSKGMNTHVKGFVKEHYESGKTDLFSCFQIQGGNLAKAHGMISMVTMESWMFLSSHEELRTYLNRNFAIKSLVHMPYLGKGGTSMGINFGTVTYAIRKLELKEYVGEYSCIRYFETDVNGVPFEFPTPNERRAKVSQREMEAVPGIPIAYWISDTFREAFSHGLLRDIGICRNGMTTGNNDLFLRFWHEVNYSNFSNDIMQTNRFAKWVPYSKGGEFRRWYGNNDLVVNWKDNGQALKDNKPKTIIRSESYYFQEAVTWSLTSSTNFGSRLRPAGGVFDVNGMSGFFPDPYPVLAVLNSRLAFEFLRVINPTMAFQSGDVERVAYGDLLDEKLLADSARALVCLTKSDWDAYENSWDFSENSLCNSTEKHNSLSESYDRYAEIWRSATSRAQDLEGGINRAILSVFKLDSEIDYNVKISDITLSGNAYYRYGGALTDEEREARLRSDTMRELVSYAVGCTMGRYSLAEPGLIYAHSGGIDFDSSRYGPFPADNDGIIPLTEEQWFADDAAARIEEFLGVAWPDAPVMETMTTLMDGLAMGNAVEPRAALRSYLSKQYYKDHLQTYKNRPIYWLFSSGKQKAFEALVYLHRYNEGTLARMRTVYVTPLMGKLQQRISDLDSEIAASSSSAEKTRKTRDKDKLAKQVLELREFDEELRHVADQRIVLDLDDGVKVNYAKFGNLLAAKDKVCPKKKGEDE